MPDAAAARALLLDRRPAVLDGLREVAERHGSDPRALEAATLGAARLGLRHGSFGHDGHAYHNEGHVLEVGHRRLLRLVRGLGSDAPAGMDVDMLLAFAGCHDLRQREPIDVPGPVGGNEAASVAEALRILESCGYARDDDRPQFVALELMIAGSTFDARPLPASDPADPIEAAYDYLDLDEPPILAGGSFARGLAAWLDGELPAWRGDADARRGERLARLAADLDTGNVGESFELLCGTALRLCREREMRLGRALDAPISAQPCLDFLGTGQQRYFHDLHRFSSREGERVFGPMKRVNAARVEDATARLHATFADAPPPDGQAVLSAFAALTGAIEEPGALQ